MKYQALQEHICTQDSTRAAFEDKCMRVRASAHDSTVSSQSHMRQRPRMHLSCAQTFSAPMRASAQNSEVSSEPGMHMRSGQHLSCAQAFCELFCASSHAIEVSSEPSVRPELLRASCVHPLMILRCIPQTRHAHMRSGQLQSCSQALCMKVRASAHRGSVSNKQVVPSPPGQRLSC